MGSGIISTTVRDGYDEWAPSYDAYDNPLTALEETYVRECVGDPNGLYIADVGCGTGRHTRWFAERGARITAVDFSTGMLDVLRLSSEGSSIEVVEHDLMQGIPLPSDTYDVVLCCLVLEHMPALKPIITEMGRICRPGGRVVLSDLHPQLTRRGVHARYRPEPGAQKRQIEGVSHAIADYVNAAVEAGLSIVRMIERDVGHELVARSASAGKWVGEPFLFGLELQAPDVS